MKTSTRYCGKEVAVRNSNKPRRNTIAKATETTTEIASSSVAGKRRATQPLGSNGAKKPKLETKRIVMVGNGFEKGLKVEKIIGASRINGKLMFYLLFKGEKATEVLPASIVNNKIPQMVIKFYEENLAWL